MLDSEVAEVFTFWRDLLATKSKLDDRRRRLIRARLDDGYSVDELKLACLGCRASPFHQGDNDRNTRYCSIDLICRSAEKIDQFVEIAETEASRMAKRATKQAQESAPLGPMPSGIRTKIAALLGRFNPQASSQAAALNATAAKAPPKAAEIESP